MVKKQTFNDAVSSDDKAVAKLDEPTEAPARVYSATPEFERDDVTYPRLRLAQGLTQEVADGVAKSGDWVLVGYDAETSVTIIPLMVAKTREYRDKEDNTHVLCASPDAKTGYGDPGGVCAECPLADWLPDPRNKDRNLAPPCSVVWSYIAWSVTHATLVSLDFRRSGTLTAKFINTLLSSKGVGRVAIEVGAKAQKGPRGQFYVPTAKMVSADESDLTNAKMAMGVV